MPSKTSKKQLVLDFIRARNLQRVEATDLQAARNELRRCLGPGDRTSLGYIAAVLRDAGYQVQYEDRYSDPVMPEPYAGRLKHVLEFQDLHGAETSLEKLDEIWRAYRSAGDQPGAKFVRELVKKGRLRAQSLAANSRIQEAKRQEKREIAQWFQVWLETPDLFADWLTLRKSSDEFRARFGTPSTSE